MTHRKLLIVNADDFGLSEGVNRGIIAAHERGIVTSTSLMITQPAAEAAAEYAKSRPQLSVGLHVDLGEWARDPATGEWRAIYAVVDTRDREAVEGEVLSQVKRFRRILGRDPTHIDSHQHVHKDAPARDVVFRTAKALRIPMRHFSRTVTYCGRFYGQDADNTPRPENITAQALCRIIAELPAGVTELACHPGDDDALVSPYRAERKVEVSVLTDERVKNSIREHGVVLCSFADLRAKLGGNFGSSEDTPGRNGGSGGGILSDLGKLFFGKRRSVQ
jgi:predicted glycoside hydrolase/deacetylase ChbG (UPF0249 family)